MITSWTVARDDIGVISVTPVGQTAEVSATTGHSILVTGGSLLIDVAAPEVGLSARIADLESAAWWFPSVFGEVVADAAAELEDTDDAVTITVESEAGDLAETASRLLVGLWFRRWWPAKRRDIPEVQEWLLDVELGALAYEGELLFTSREPARELLEGHLEKLATEYERYLNIAGTTEGDAIGSVLSEAVTAALEAVHVDAPGYDAVDEAAERAQSREDLIERASAQLGDELSDVVEGWAREASREPEYVGELVGVRDDFAMAAGHEKPEHSGGVLVDWAEIHPRSLDNDGGYWSVSGGIITVEVSSGTGSIPIHAGELFARVRIDGATFAVALDRTPQGYEGNRELEALVGATMIEVSLYSDEYSAGGRVPSPESESIDRQDDVITVVKKRVAQLRATQPAEQLRPFAFEIAAIASE